MPLNPEIPLSVRLPTFINPMDTLQQIGQMRMQQQAIRSNQALEEDRRLGIERERQGMQQQQRVGELTQEAFVPDEQTGIYAFNRPLFERGLMQSGLGHLYEKLAPRMDAMEKSAQSLVASKRSLLAHTVDAIGEAGWTPDAVDNAAQFLLKNEAYDPGKIKPLLEAIHQNPTPENIQATLTSVVKGLPEWQELQTKKQDATGKRQKDAQDLAIGAQTLRQKTAEAKNLEEYGTTTRPAPSAIHREWTDYVNETVKAGGKPMPFNDYMTMDANRKRSVTNINVGGGAETAGSTPDPASNDILSQTGLSMNAFMAMTGRLTQLPRDANTRNRATAEAQAFARKQGVDISTLASQYKAQNAVLESNISRLNNTKIMESELKGTVENMQQVIGTDLSKVRIANVWKVWAGEQVNDPQAQQYAFHLGQLRNELAAYYAAAAGRPGSGITVQDLQEAERTIKSGISQGGLKGLQKGVEDSTAKMGPIMQSSVDRAQKAVWSLFGVGQHYKDTASKTAPAGNKIGRFEIIK